MRCLSFNSAIFVYLRVCWGLSRALLGFPCGLIHSMILLAMCLSAWSPHMPYSKNYFHFLFPFLDPSVGGCSSDGCSDGIVKLVASLSMQVCRMNPPFCEDLHRGPQSSQELPNPSVFKMREEMLQVIVIQSVNK